jgi:hypothetical protein
MEELVILEREIRAVTAAVKEMSAAVAASESAGIPQQSEERSETTSSMGAVTATGLSLALKTQTGRS